MKTVLIITNSREKNIENVLSELKKCGQNYVLLTTDDLIKHEPGLCLHNDLHNSYFTIDSKKIDTTDIKSVWYRRPRKIEVSDGLPLEQKTFIRDEFQSSLWSLYTTLPTYWMNHPLNSHYLLEHNKLYQLKMAIEVGMSVPKTVVTNIPKELIDFSEKHGGSIAIKVICSRLFQETLGTWGIYTTRVDTKYLKEHSADIALAPLMGQEYVPKLIELRVTVVHDQIFACAIHSQDSIKTKDDWRRYDFTNVKHEPYHLPDKVVAMIHLYMRNCALTYGAIDMIVTPQGDHVFLEINPSGQYSWIEALTKMPISKAIADTLINPPLLPA